MKSGSGKTDEVQESASHRHAPEPPHAGKRINAVFLVGFMGAGKSTVARCLAQQLNWTFEDLDDRIEQRQQRGVSEIFRVSGERAFRDTEHSALKALLAEVLAGSAKVVALGGGAFVQARNEALLANASVNTVFLDAPAEELWRRCSAQAGEYGIERPLLRSEEQFRQLYDTRRTSYTRASVTVDTAGRDVNEIATEIAKLLGLRPIGERTAPAEDE